MGTYKKKQIPDGVHMVNFRLEDELFQLLDAYCDEVGYTKSGLLRKLVKKELEGYTLTK
jgi:predicted DNA-binding protein